MTRNNRTNLGGRFSIDTTFVLFFLALELGRGSHFFAVDTLLMAITTLMVIVLPYYLLSTEEPPSFGMWLGGRSVIAGLGVLLGFVFQASVGVLVPDLLRFVPMTALVIAAMISCYFQLYCMMKLRLAK